MYMQRQVEEPRVVRALMASGPTAAAGSGRDRLECVLVRVRGQSFMLNQIRKMLGFAVAVVRGIAPDSVLDMAFGPAKVCVACTVYFMSLFCKIVRMARHALYSRILSM